jgi:hypothetical protein
MEMRLVGLCILPEFAAGSFKIVAPTAHLLKVAKVAKVAARARRGYPAAVDLYCLFPLFDLVVESLASVDRSSCGYS